MNSDDLTGRTFGYLTVIKSLPKNNNNKKQWLCRCVCGREIPVIEGNLKSGNSIRCGKRDCISKRKDLTGQRFGKLTVIEYAGLKESGNKGKRANYWLCKCDCGNQVEVKYSNIITGHTKSCGCLQKEVLLSNITTHNSSRTRLYKIYQNMKSRCYNPASTEYEHYGGKGIKICEEWLNDFKQFKIWAENNKYSNELTIDRIDNTKGYNPKNCRWITIKEQSRNKSNNHKIKYCGKEYILTDIVQLSGIPWATFQYRLKQGWSAEEIIKYYKGDLI